MNISYIKKATYNLMGVALICIHLQKMPELAKLVNTDLSRGFTVPQIAEKHACLACPVAPVDGTGVGSRGNTGTSRKIVLGDGRSLWSGPWLWKAKMILNDLRYLTKVCRHGICGTGTTVYPVKFLPR